MPTLTTVIKDPATIFIPNMMKIMLASEIAIACPAIILAKSRIISAKGLVKILKNSMNGINGTGTFNQVGTSGQNISFQYAFVPVKFVIRNVQRAKRMLLLYFLLNFLLPVGMVLFP